MSPIAPPRLSLAIVLAVTPLAALFPAPPALAKQEYRNAFFAVYPSAVGSVLDTVPSQTTHCGVCHYRFTGGGARNPFGLLVEATLPNYPNTTQGRQDAIWSIRNQDPDGDGHSTLIEVTDTQNFTNTPTFPGLTPANVGNVTNVSVADIQDHLVPATGGDTTPPTVTVLSPNGGETLFGNGAASVQWTATDASGIAGINLFVSLDNGATYTPVARNLWNTGSFTWFVPDRPTALARVRVEAIDNAFNTGFDVSNAVFSVVAPPGGRVPTTLRDFDMPGTQPLGAGVLNPPQACLVCHGEYDLTVEPYFNWRGSMMANASLDPLFEAAMTIANQDAPDSGDLCIRCHVPQAWLGGRSVPTSGSQILPSDRFGVACDLCHRLVDPIPAAENPAEDAAILAALAQPPTLFTTGQYVVDPTGARRGPFANAATGHPILVSPFHREAALCGTCHDISNPAFTRDQNGNYLPNAFDAPATNFHSHSAGVVERTYSEWLNSQYNTPQGVFAPQFGGNKPYVATCQDCHMRDVTGKGCNFTEAPTRTDLPLHDLTGANTWLPALLAQLFPGEVDLAALQAGVERARHNLQNAAELGVSQQSRTLIVTVTNSTGHKLPTGYPEGRRMWLNVRFFDAAMNLVGESGAYDPVTATLAHDPEVKVYEIEPTTSGIPTLPDGSLFHFALNNAVLKDNRIPPRGFTNAAYAAFGGAPVGYAYADGQYWDDTTYEVPRAAASCVVTLYYQSASKEFVEFLRDENVTDNKGQLMYDLWAANGRCPPEIMAQVAAVLAPAAPADFNEDGFVDMDDYTLLIDCLLGPMVAVGSECTFEDLDADEDVDLADVSMFQPAFTGSDSTPPAAPTGLSVVAGDGVVMLDWNENSEGDLAGYTVYRSTIAGGPYVPVNAALLPASSHVDHTVINGITYYYVVTASDTNANESGYSTEASATPQAVTLMHVASIVPSVNDLGAGQKYGVATVTIVTNLGVPVANATVTGVFSGDFNGTRSGATNAAGVAVITIGPKNGRTNFTFCVTGVTHAAMTYDPGANVVTCASYP